MNRLSTFDVKGAFFMQQKLKLWVKILTNINYLVLLFQKNYWLAEIENLSHPKFVRKEKRSSCFAAVVIDEKEKLFWEILSDGRSRKPLEEDDER